MGRWVYQARSGAVNEEYRYRLFTHLGRREGDEGNVIESPPLPPKPTPFTITTFYILPICTKSLVFQEATRGGTSPVCSVQGARVGGWAMEMEHPVG